jgi:transposase
VLSLPGSIRILVATDPVDFRKAHDGLVSVVRDHIGGDPFDGSVFVFTNKRRDRIKLLLWDRNGFWLLYKRLERGTFRSFARHGNRRVEVSRAELSMLLEGIDLEAGKIRRHFADGIHVEGRGDRGVENANQAAG